MTKHSPSYPTGSDTLLCSCGQRFGDRDGYLAHWDRMAAIEAANVLVVILCGLAGMGLAFFLALGTSLPGPVLLVGMLVGLAAGSLLMRSGRRSCPAGMVGFICAAWGMFGVAAIRTIERPPRSQDAKEAQL